MTPTQLSQELNDCGCCDGLEASTPLEIYNRPGLSQITYQIGTYSSFKRTLLARLSGPRETALRVALQRLNTRDDDDFSLALLDAWAMTGDVLTFYQERLANEQYLRTATERLSLAYLARLIGYELRPGAAASVALAFTLEETPGSPGQDTPGVPAITTIPKGTKAQSIPESGQQPQTFETIQEIEARRAWNRIIPRQVEPPPVSSSLSQLTVAGLPNLSPGDALLIPDPANSGQAFFRRVRAVLPDQQHAQTVIKLANAPNKSISVSNLPSSSVTPPAPGPLVQKYQGQTISEADLQVYAQTDEFEVQNLFEGLRAQKPPNRSAYVLRTRGAIFGHNALPWSSLPYAQRAYETVYNPKSSGSSEVVATTVNGPYNGRSATWVDPGGGVSHSGTLAKYHGESSSSKNVFLDSTYSGFGAGGPVVLVDGNSISGYQIDVIKETSKADFTLSAKVTRLTLNERTGFENFSIRSTSVFGAPEELVLLPQKLSPIVGDNGVDLDGWVEGLTAGRTLLVCGDLADEPGLKACERAILQQVTHWLAPGGFTHLVFEKDLEHSFRRDTVVIYANVAEATHGESRQEVLGSGDAGQAFQEFTLRQPPLTYIKAETPSGTASTLEVRVNEVLWKPVEWLEGHGPTERVYTTQRNNDGSLTIQFGDGQTGARPATGQENITAEYRRGIGLDGLAKVGQISLLMTRPPGVKGVNNLLPSEGAADPESPDNARRNAPLTVLTLDRIVSLQDYQDFASAFAGIAKAHAAWSWSGQTRKIFLTLAGPDGAEIKSDNQTMEFLLKAMRKAGDPLVPIQAASYDKKSFKIAGQVKIHPDYRQELVMAAVESALRKSFSFAARELGQPVILSEVISAIQAVEGVIAVNISQFYRSLETPASEPPMVIVAHLPEPTADGMTSAQLLILDPAPLSDLGVMS